MVEEMDKGGLQEEEKGSSDCPQLRRGKESQKCQELPEFPAVWEGEGTGETGEEEAEVESSGDPGDQEIQRQCA